MGVKGRRPQREQCEEFIDPPLITDVEAIINMATSNGFIDAKGNVQLDKVAQSENIEVEYVDLPSTESGFFRSSNGVYVIGINKKHNSRRQRFTFAHELGHYFLHKGTGDTAFSDEVFYRIENSSSIEYAANEFAARLLIPENRLTEKLNQGMIDLRELAEEFEVSIAAMEYRVKSLGYSIERYE